MKVYQLLDDHEDSSVLQALSKKGEIILNSIETLENTLKWETPYLTFFLEKETKFPQKGKKYRIAYKLLIIRLYIDFLQWL